MSTMTWPFSCLDLTAVYFATFSEIMTRRRRFPAIVSDVKVEKQFQKWDSNGIQ
jgi:hypothetical protein